MAILQTQGQFVGKILDIRLIEVLAVSAANNINAIAQWVEFVPSAVRWPEIAGKD